MSRASKLPVGELDHACLRAERIQAKTWQLPESAQKDIKASAKALTAMLDQGQTLYGVNTGFGKLAQQKISTERLEILQHHLILSHAVGTGAELDKRIVNLIMLLKINSLAQGYSGVRIEVLQQLITFYNHRVTPCIPSQGSVGASGDLAPLAHLACALVGVGEVVVEGNRMTASDMLKRLNLAPLTLAPKEGLALLNGTQVSTAIALDALYQLETLFETALMAGALTVDAIRGSDIPFDARIQQVRRQPAQIKVAQWLSSYLQDSQIRASHRECKRVQDPYSVRCQPQVMGACLNQIEYALDVLAHEINAVTDNPLVFAQDEKVLSGGNFHAQPVAFASDALALAIAEIGSLSERRTALLIDTNQSGLPPFLIANSGENSGFMIAQVTAAALVSENKHLATPVSVDSIPTSANQEDHVSMATYAARRLHQMLDNLAAIIAIELMAACQGIDFHAPLKTSKPLQKVMHLIRAQVPFYDEDRFMAPDLDKIKKMVLLHKFDLSSS